MLLKKLLGTIRNIGLAGYLLLLALSCDFTPRIYKQILRAQRLVAEQRYAEAIEEYERILEKPHEEQAKTYYQVGELYSIHLLENKKALPYYKKSIEISDDPRWMIRPQERIAEINFSFLKDYVSASEDYKKLVALASSPEKRDFYQYRLAISLVNARNIEAGYAILQKIGKNPGHAHHVRAIYDMGMYYFFKKKWKEAVAQWEKYIKKETRRDNITQARFLMANAYETMEDLKTAYNIYRSLLADYPNMEIVKNRLEAIYARRVARKR